MFKSRISIATKRQSHAVEVVSASNRVDGAEDAALAADAHGPEPEHWSGGRWHFSDDHRHQLHRRYRGRLWCHRRFRTSHLWAY